MLSKQKQFVTYFFDTLMLPLLYYMKLAAVWNNFVACFCSPMKLGFPALTDSFQYPIKYWVRIDLRGSIT